MRPAVALFTSILVCLLILTVDPVSAASRGPASLPAPVAKVLAGRRAVLVSPEEPRPGGPLRVLAA
ncbi:MAG: hypothetical protein ACXWGZ_07515, partial [Candidatus Aminicenantales bacterium]